MSEQDRRISRQELYNRNWKTTLQKVAEELGTTYAELARVCNELNVPKPAHGYGNFLIVISSVTLNPNGKSAGTCDTRPPRYFSLGNV